MAIFNDSKRKTEKNNESRMDCYSGMFGRNSLGKIFSVQSKIRTSASRMWFRVVCTLIDNDMRHHSGQIVVDATNFIYKRQRNCFFQSVTKRLSLTFSQFYWFIPQNECF